MVHFAKYVVDYQNMFSVLKIFQDSSSSISGGVGDLAQLKTPKLGGFW
jgi:hypothetical protein